MINLASDRNIDPDIAEVRAALSCWRQGIWSRAYAFEQFERLLQGFVDRNAVETTDRHAAREDLAYCHGAQQAAAMAHQSLAAMDKWIAEGCGNRHQLAMQQLKASEQLYRLRPLCTCCYGRTDDECPIHGPY